MGGLRVGVWKMKGGWVESGGVEDEGRVCEILVSILWIW